MADEPTVTVLGIRVPDAGPVFLAAVAAHVGAGLVAVIAGTLAALSRKRRGRHPRAGTVFLTAVAVIVVTATVMSAIRWQHNRHLLAVSTVTAVLATVGWLARRRRWRRWMLWHGITMSGAFIALLTGFYLDNGPQLPVWDRLPPLAFWFLPAAVGIPLTWWALVRNHALPCPRPEGRRAGAARP
ncbi:hypothetical protein Sya03_59650 [Spirilliplanes yamanashiensis]|uniref:DUF2306 domain-containing protein n=1 Tax=Spirilliplanes yamanashiensis TaxID=42233 RepID=A0A8J4DMM6_9ACTN|nr:hypothetical protein Sya03_59650 [Spirilliplanes yamanashiensis]